VHNVWAAVDPGIVISPDNVVAQIEGATLFGVSHALQERITVSQGVVQQSNFHDYQLLRLADAPEVRVSVISTDNNPTGIGEAGRRQCGGRAHRRARASASHAARARAGGAARVNDQRRYERSEEDADAHGAP